MHLTTPFVLLGLSSLSLAASTAAPASASAANNPDSSVGKTLYVTSPACGFYKCVVDWVKGETVQVNWLAPPTGNVSVELASNDGGATYSIVSSYPAISQPGYCDAGNGVGVVVEGTECGMIEFVVPNAWVEAANYTIVVQSLTDSTAVGYTDAITIQAANSTYSGSTVSAVTLLTIAGAPTSTNTDAGTSNTGSIPAATAGVAVASTASSAATGSSSAGSSSKGSSSSGTKASGSASSGASSSGSESSSASASASSKAASSGAGKVGAGAGLVGAAAAGLLWALV